MLPILVGFFYFSYQLLNKEDLIAILEVTVFMLPINY